MCRGNCATTSIIRVGRSVELGLRVGGMLGLMLAQGRSLVEWIWMWNDYWNAAIRMIGRLDSCLGLLLALTETRLSGVIR